MNGSRLCRCRIALGGNVGDVPAAFRAALGRLAGPNLRVVAVSRCYVTPPMGSAAGGDFRNAAATLETTLGPAATLARLHAVEDALGRTRSVRWGPRPVDLDLILFGDATVDTPTLAVPHPACWFRRFVLDPLAEIASDARHPATGETVADLRARLLARPFVLAIDGPAAAALAAELAEEFPQVRWVRGPTAHAAMTVQPGWNGISAAERTVGVPAPQEVAAEAVRALLTAALGEPILATD